MERFMNSFSRSKEEITKTTCLLRERLSTTTIYKECGIIEIANMHLRAVLRTS